MVSEIEIVIAIIVVIFSGIWSAIKWMDEQTDNKWVFLVPASVLGLAIFMEIGGGFLFWVFLLALGPVVVMLTKVGLEQGKVPQKRSYSPISNQNRKTENNKISTVSWPPLTFEPMTD